MKTWQRQKQFIDPVTGHHVIVLVNVVTGATHRLQVVIGHDHCPHCGRVQPKTNTGELDPHALEAEEIANLESVHENIHAYAKKHQVLVRKRR